MHRLMNVHMLRGTCMHRLRSVHMLRGHVCTGLQVCMC